MIVTCAIMSLLTKQNLEKPTRDKIMKTVYATVNSLNGKVSINNQSIGTKLSCTSDDFNHMHRWGYNETSETFFFSGTFNITDGILTITVDNGDDSEF